MRLLNSRELSITSKLVDNIPPYAILSHTWGAEADEPTFQDLHHGLDKTKPGYDKIAFCAKQANEDGLQHFWIDTCCIDKTDDSEVVDAITSMFNWYRGARKCYVYLSDVSFSSIDPTTNPPLWEAAFRNSRWFTRGWTLPELVAPAVVQFYSKEGVYLGDKQTLERLIHEITSLPVEILRGHPLTEFSVDERLQWAENRDTSRKEDTAYCLLGILGVDLSIIYGEGDHAFARLKRKIANPSTNPPITLTHEEKEAIQAFSTEVDCLTQKNRNEICVPNTGQWFFHHPKYEEFCSSHGSRLLFVTAEAGSGKSTIMKAFIDSLHVPSSNALVAYFFFKDDNDLQRSYHEALSAVVHQLLVQRPALVKYVKHFFQVRGQHVKHQTAEIWKMLRDFAKHSEDDIVCVFDAVDECDTRGRTQLLQDLKCHIQSTTSSRMRLKFVVSSRPYQDRYHPYEDLIHCSSRIHHLDGENGKFASDISRVISSKLDELARKKSLSERTSRLLLDKITERNVQTKSFLWVKLAFEFLSADPRLHMDASKQTIDTILAAVPESIEGLFEQLLRSCLDQKLARKILSVILAARRTLKIRDLKTIYCLAQTPNEGIDLPKTYDDLEIVEDDERFKSLIRSTCGLFVTFVKTSVHLFHQTAREYLMQDFATRKDMIVAESSTMWKHSITAKQANYDTASICLRLLDFTASDDWVRKVFRNMALSNFREAIQDYCSARPFLLYSACNWYEHMSLSGDLIGPNVRAGGNPAMFDISSSHFWTWFLIACDQVCLGRSIIREGWKNEPVAKVWADFTPHGHNDRGLFLRNKCLRNMCPSDVTIQALFFDESPLSDESVMLDGLMWTATGGYSLINAFHLANGEWKHTSMSKAISALECGNEEFSDTLLEGVSVPTLIWTSMIDGKPHAFTKALALTKNTNWLEEIPGHILEHRLGRFREFSLYHGPETAGGVKTEQQKREAQYPPSFGIMMQANTSPSNHSMFSALADWVDNSQSHQVTAERTWRAGGFINAMLSERLIRSGAMVDEPLWRDRLTALQIAATFWEHDTLQKLLALGADAFSTSANGYNALHWFCFAEGGPGKATSNSLSSQRHRKAQINESMRKILSSTVDKKVLMHQQDAKGITPLMLAVHVSSTMTRHLLMDGVAVDQRDNNGCTALMHFFDDGWEYQCRRTSILHALLDFGADAGLSDDKGITAVGYWAQQILSQRMSDLYPGSNAHNMTFDALDNRGPLSRTGGMRECLQTIAIPLAAAVRLGNAQLCRYLVSAGASVNESGVDEKSALGHNSGTVSDELQQLAWNPLMLSVFSKAYVTAAYLLEHGADINNKVLESALREYHAHKAGTTLLHFLVEANPDGPGGLRYSQANLYMATGGSLEGCSFEAAGHPDKVVKKVSTDEQLMMYCHNHSTSADEELVGTDSEMETLRGGSINDSSGANLLPFDKLKGEVDPGATNRDALFDFIYTGKTTLRQRQQALLELLLRRGIDKNAQNKEGIAPLMICARNGRTDLAELLIDHGADLNIAATTGLTPLMAAAQRGHRDMVELLINAGAHVNPQMLAPPPSSSKCARFETNEWFNWCVGPITALAFAAERGHYDVVKLLLDGKADPNLKIVHHMHGLLLAKDKDKRRSHKWARQRKQPLGSDIDSEPEPEIWKGYISVATALTWARDEVRELLLQYGADPLVEEPIRECDCVIEKIEGIGKDFW